MKELMSQREKLKNWSMIWKCQKVSLKGNFANQNHTYLKMFGIIASIPICFAGDLERAEKKYDDLKQEYDNVMKDLEDM